jgi:hypothetical protein
MKTRWYDWPVLMVTWPLCILCVVLLGITQFIPGQRLYWWLIKKWK